MLIRRQVPAFALVPPLPFRYTALPVVEKFFRFVNVSYPEILRGVRRATLCDGSRTPKRDHFRDRFA